MTSADQKALHTNLVVVACHAHFLGDPEAADCDVYSPQQWNLQPFQQPRGHKPGEHETFLDHIQAGLNKLSSGAAKDNSILIFSGGFTSNSVHLSEARSYFRAAIALTKLHGQSESCKSLFGSKIFLEEHATDSYQNLLFSLLCFRKAIGRYPETIQIITHAFKSERFLMSHAKAIRWPSDRIRVQGIDPVMSVEEYEDTKSGERQRGFLPWTQDMYGRREPLKQKRVSRGWQESTLDVLSAEFEPGIGELLRYDGGEEGQTLYHGNLPWCRV
ncbi:cytoplasm protein [Diplodia corticola]|uniref:Cytoplasm protein n=1 Tax=Diplodia corticola TaxID=236234 RepID=A0A1J9RGK6_9PEZI|nr:cytoplasm protein [Diplodia corticola]OJD31667.1 cytoplasm protein [Diplodia corticola]